MLVLNRTNLLQRALPYINDLHFEEVHLYYDNDDAGESATCKLFEAGHTPLKLADMRSYYKGYDDLNAWLIGQRA